MSKFAHSLPQGAAAPDADGPRRALILPGGGLRLSYAAGALAEIFARGLTFQHMDATSGGALNLAMLFSGLDIEEICRRWRTLRMRDTFSPMPLANYLLPARFVAASASKAFRKKVYPHLGIDFESIRAVEGVQGTFNLCDFSTKTNRVVPHREMTEDFLVAGMSLPATLPPVEVGGVLYLDSGFIQDANLMEAVRRGASELWLIWVMGNVPHYRSGPLNAYVQMLEMSANSALIKDMQHIREINERIARGEQPYGHRQPIRLHLIKPKHPLPLDLALYTGAITHDELIERGRADARDYFAGMVPEGVPLEPETLKMTTRNPGLQFKETMVGGFALGVTEAAQGLANGTQQNQQLVINQMRQQGIDAVLHGLPNQVSSRGGNFGGAITQAIGSTLGQRGQILAAQPLRQRLRTLALPSETEQALPPQCHDRVPRARAVQQVPHHRAQAYQGGGSHKRSHRSHVIDPLAHAQPNDVQHHQHGKGIVARRQHQRQADGFRIYRA